MLAMLGTQGQRAQAVSPGTRGVRGKWVLALTARLLAFRLATEKLYITIKHSLQPSCIAEDLSVFLQSNLL